MVATCECTTATHLEVERPLAVGEVHTSMAAKTFCAAHSAVTPTRVQPFTTAGATTRESLLVNTTNTTTHTTAAVHT